MRPDDEELPRRAVELRALLEAAYGQRLTFRGENREPTGTKVTVRQVLGDVEGRVVGADADVGPGATVKIDQEASNVRPGGPVEGIRGRIRG